MTDKLLIDRATLEQLVVALNEVDQHVDLKRYDTAPNEVLFDVVMEAMVKGRAALASADPTGWQTLVDHGKEAHELAKIMKDFADKNPKSLMLKELDK